MVAQLARRRRIEDVAGFLEGAERVGVEHLRPHIAVIGRRIAAAGKDMPEMRRAMTHDDLVRHADARHFLFLERGDVEIVARFQRVEFEIDQGGGDIFHRRPAHVEIARLQEPLEHRFRHRLAGFVMQGEAPQHFRPLEPMLVELRGQFHPIGQHIGARHHRIGHVGEKSVQAVAEFMEQRARVVVAEQIGAPSPPC